MLIMNVVLAFNLFFFQSPASIRKTDREQQGLRGNVRSMLLEIARLSDDGKREEGKHIMKFVTRFDEKGNITEEVSISDGRILQRITYDYDSAGNFTRKLYSAKLDVGNNNPSKSEVRTQKCLVKHDTSGDKVEQACFKEDGELQSKSQFNYNENKKEIAQYKGDGSLISKCIVTGDERGQTIEEICSYPKGIASSSRHTFRNEYDSTGNWVKRFSSAWQTDDGKEVFIGNDIIYRTISYDASKDVYPEDGSKHVDSLPARPLVIRKSGGVLAKEAISKPEPEYPRAASEARVSGEVVVEVTIDEQGNVISARALSGHPLLKDAAIDAARQWKFKQTKLSGVPVKVIGTITFNFNL